MWVQKIPEFHSGHILKREMMAELSAYLYRLGPLLYQNCADGIVSGCMLTTTEDSIVVNPGIIRYEGDFYLIREPQFALYAPTNTTRVLNLVFHDQVQTDSFVTREIELAFTEGASAEKRYLELCRFKLQPGARLRYTYTSFADRETEYDTLNIIHAPFCGMGRPTLSPEITAHFAREALDAGAEGTDAMFCMMLLASKEPVQAEALEAYIHSKLGKDYACHSNLGMYQGLISCLKQFKGGQDTAAPKRKAWSIMVD